LETGAIYTPLKTGAWKTLPSHWEMKTPRFPEH